MDNIIIWITSIFYAILIVIVFIVVLFILSSISVLAKTIIFGIIGIILISFVIHNLIDT